MNIESLSKRFWKYGYVVLPDFFDASLMNKMQIEIMAHFGVQPDFSHTQEFLEKSATEVVPWFPQQDANKLFDQIDEHPSLTELTGSILGENWRSLYCMAMFSKAGTKGQAWHQDCPPDNPAKYNLNRLVYTMDINENTGGQVLVKPGSHLDGELTVGEPHEDFEDQICLSPKKGTLVIIHGHTWHRVLPVNSKCRVSTNYRAIPEGTEEDITDICVYRNMRYQFSSNCVLQNRIE